MKEKEAQLRTGEGGIFLVPMRAKAKEAVAAIEEERNKYDAPMAREDRTLTESERKKGGASGSEKQFKQPQGSHQDRISSKYTPLMAQN